MKTGSERDRAGLLGMTWNPKEDTPQFPPKAIVIPPDVRFTKRQVLSSAKSKFDPIGLIFPVLVPAKKFISSLWYKGFDWDEVPPDEPQQQCNQIAKEIEAVSAFVTSRHLDFDKALPIEMHVFCDACTNSSPVGINCHGNGCSPWCSHKTNVQQGFSINLIVLVD